MAPGTTGQRSAAERRRSENLDAPVPSRRRAHAVEIDWSRRLETRRQRFAGAAVESLARAWSLQTQNASPLRRDQECVRNASREHCNAAASERLLATINVDELLALALDTYDRNQRAHCHLDLTFLFRGTLVP